jgi:ribosome-associated translation inhibitor RaiA
MNVPHMETRIYFTGMPTSASMEDFIGTHLTSLKRRLNKGRKSYAASHIDVRLRVTGHKPTGLPKGFEAEVLVAIPHRSWIVIRKKHANPQIAVSTAITAAEKVMRRETEKGEHGRRRLGKTRRLVREFKRTQPKT